MPNFDFYNINICKSESSNDLIVKGEITNNSGRSYQSVAIRIILFDKNIQIANSVAVVNGLSSGATKNFEKRMEELDYGQVIKSISRHEIYTESAY